MHDHATKEIQPTKPKWGNEQQKARPAMPSSLTWLEFVHVVMSCMFVACLAHVIQRDRVIAVCRLRVRRT